MSVGTETRIGPVFRAWVIALTVLAGVCGRTPAQAEQIELKSALVVEGVSRGGRTLLQTDAVEHLRVTGEWKAPREGAEVVVAEGASRAWRKKEAGEDGWIGVRGGGYAYWSVESPEDRVMILEASGHGAAIVNGEARVGDPYEYGYVKAPVLVKKGENEILLRAGRGRVRAKLVPPRAEVFFNTGDVTLPDLLIGEGEALGSVVVVNATTKALTDGWVRVRVGDRVSETRLPAMLPLSMRKVGFSVPWDGKPRDPAAREEAVKLSLGRGEKAFDETTLTLGVRKPSEKHKRTFISEIDGSVQYYAVVPPPAGTDLSEPKALILSLHGASVEATNQANCYKQRDWCYVVCPTNRRPFGFDWEDWGRQDALEVLGEARRRFRLDDRRTYLTGHSMGGHGTWNVGVQFPGTFAAIGPSAGWISFATYGGGRARSEDDSPIEKILARAVCTSDTLSMKRNLAQQGIYILHGDADDNVPVGQARTMRKELAEFHRDFAYYEEPGAGHWWGDQCVDWDPMIEFFRRHARPEAKDITRVEFTTVNPGVSGTCDWVTIEQQIRQFEPSRVSIAFDREKGRYSGTTENVAAVSLAVASEREIRVELDGQEVAISPGAPVRLVREGGSWRAASGMEGGRKGAGRYGLFKTALANRMVLVYSTGGTAEENAWSEAKARYDAETFWYRGNGSVEVVSDRELVKLVAEERVERNIVLYGNADTNAAWKEVVGEGPAFVGRGVVRIGAREVRGEDAACLMVRPRAKGGAMVGVVGGTGLVGMRLTDRLAYFVSGVGVPDWVVMTPRLLKEGAAGVSGAGFFGNDWTVENGEGVWGE